MQLSLFCSICTTVMLSEFVRVHGTVYIEVARNKCLNIVLITNLTNRVPTRIQHSVRVLLCIIVYYCSQPQLR